MIEPNKIVELEKAITAGFVKQAADLGFFHCFTVNDRHDIIRHIEEWLRHHNLQVNVDYMSTWHVLRDTRTFWFRKNGLAVLCKLSCIK
jgi:hypothetical protein